MKSSELLEEIKENVQEYDIENIKENLKEEDINPISKQVSIFNLRNYDEIMETEISSEEDEIINDKMVESMKNEIDLFFKGCSPESEDSFKKFIESICLYLSFIAKKPLHPVGMDFGNGNTVHEEKENGKTIYYCDLKEYFRQQEKDYYTCKFCVCKSC